MDRVSLMIGLCWTFAGLLTIGLSIPLARGRVARNAWYGFRTPESQSSDAAWLAINRHAGRRMMVVAAAWVVIGVACLLVPLQGRPGLAIALGFAPLAILLWAVVDGMRFAHRHAKVA